MICLQDFLELSETPLEVIALLATAPLTRIILVVDIGLAQLFEPRNGPLELLLLFDELLADHAEGLELILLLSQKRLKTLMALLIGRICQLGDSCVQVLIPSGDHRDAVVASARRGAVRSLRS